MNAPSTAPEANDSTASPASSTERSMNCAPSATPSCTTPQPIVARRDSRSSGASSGTVRAPRQVEVVDRGRGHGVQRRRQRRRDNRRDDEAGEARRQLGRRRTAAAPRRCGRAARQRHVLVEGEEHHADAEEQRELGEDDDAAQHQAGGGGPRRWWRRAAAAPGTDRCRGWPGSARRRRRGPSTACRWSTGFVRQVPDRELAGRHAGRGPLRPSRPGISPSSCTATAAAPAT